MPDKIQSSSKELLFFYIKNSIFIILCVQLLSSCNNNKSSSNAIIEPQKPILKDTIEKSDFISFNNEKGKFNVVLPDTPVYNSYESLVEFGKIILHQFSYSKNDTLAWTVSYCDYPKEVLQIAKHKKIIKGIKKSTLSKLNANLVSESDINKSKFSTDLTFSAFSSKRDLNIYCKIILNKNRLYKLSVYSTVGKLKQEGINNFFESFTMTY